MTPFTIPKSSIELMSKWWEYWAIDLPQHTQEIEVLRRVVNTQRERVDNLEKRFIQAGF